MLKNDESFWRPSDGHDAVRLSWGSSDGDIDTLSEHARERWARMGHALESAGIPLPGGRVVEFGSGMGLLDDLLDGGCSSILMLDHTDAYLRERPRPLGHRCRYVQWRAKSLEELEQEAGSYDWLVSIAVFYHVDTVTAAALIRELGALLKPGGHVLIQGWRPAEPDVVRTMATRERLFSAYPSYALDMDLLREMLAPEYEELCREDVLVYRRSAIHT